MKILWFIPLLMLFAALSVPGVVSRSSQSPSAAQVASSTKPDVKPPVATSTEKKIVRTTTPKFSEKNKPTPQPATTSTPEVPPPVDSSAQQSPSVAFITAVEAEILRLSNEERAKENLAALIANSTLRDTAWGHSADMLAHNYFDHDNLNGCSSSCRATKAGYRWRAIGENIYMMSGFTLSAEKTAAKVVDGWINSPGHRANILSSSFAESGVGVITDGKSIYVTAMYGKIR